MLSHVGVQIPGWVTNNKSRVAMLLCFCYCRFNIEAEPATSRLRRD